MDGKFFRQLIGNMTLKKISYLTDLDRFWFSENVGSHFFKKSLFELDR